MASVRLTLALAGLMLLNLPAVAPAQEAGKPKNLVEYRQAVMSSLGGHAGAVSAIVKGQVDVDHLLPHARAIAATAATVDDIWWDNSTYEDYEKTDALPKIWQQPDDFQERIDKFQTAAKDFVDAVETGERGRIIQGFKTLGNSCGGCHDNYRYEE